MHLFLPFLTPGLTRIQFVVFQVHSTGGMKFFQKAKEMYRHGQVFIQGNPNFANLEGKRKGRSFSKVKRNVSRRTRVHSGKSQFFESGREAKRYTSFVIIV